MKDKRLFNTSHTFGHPSLADRGLIPLLGVRLRHGEGEDANSSEENGDLHSGDDLRVTKTHIVLLDSTN